MLVKSTQQPYLLTETQNQLLFLEQILPDAFDETAPAVAPKVIFLGGQPGSGKSGLSIAVQQVFSATEQAVVINSDALREYHPDFPILQKTDVDRASFLVNPDTRIWQRKLINAAVSSRRNLVLDGTLGGSPEPITETVEMLHENDYVVQISVLAVPARLSRFGIYKRYEDQIALKGTGRWVGIENHDRVYNEIPTNLVVLEGGDYADCIQIFTRTLNTSGFSLLYQNNRKAGSWEQPPAAFNALSDGRDQHWTPEEQNAFSMAVQTVAGQMRQRGVSEADVLAFYRHIELTPLTARIAQPTDVQRYFDWTNDPDTRRQSFNPAPISTETHTAWFTRKLSDPNALLLVFENEAGEAVGQVRFERTPDEIIIGISVDARHRGKGLASQLILQGCMACRERWGAVTIYAYIKPDNQASARAFVRAGFRLSGESGKFGTVSLLYINTQ